MLDLDELRKEIRGWQQCKQVRRRLLFKLLKEELSSLGYWKNKARGNPEKNGKKPEGWRDVSRWVREMRLNTCEDCGDPATQVHHLDFDSGNCKLENLKVICFQCHMKYHRPKS